MGPAELLFWIIICHFIGDYLLQSHWMATKKTERWWPAVVHGFMYTVPFMFLPISPLALFVIGSTHAIIDRYRLAKYISYLKNLIGPKASRPTFEEAQKNSGYSASTPVWLSMWLMVITDNTMHILINIAAVTWL